MKSLLLLFVFLIVSSFAGGPDADVFFESGKRNFLSKEYIKAISDFTMAISIRPDFGEAYLQRAKAKISFSEVNGFANSEYCQDLVQALHLEQFEAANILQVSCDKECYGLTKAFIEPDLVYCADFSSKMLSSLPRGSENLVNLVRLNLFNNKLASISNQVSSFSSLLAMDVSSNQVETISPLIGELKNLEELNLNKNKLSSLPSEIGKLVRIRRLYLRSNELDSLPITIGKCQELEHVDLSFNKLSSLPEEIAQLKKLKTLNLTGNSFDKRWQKKIGASLPHVEVFF
jgi:hypothetical protein